ncbi:MAG: MG2 domain-containing protein [Candidatus Kapaibacterium sp.]
MNFRSFTTRILIVISALCAFAFAGDDNSFYFSISSNKIYTPGDPETAIEFNGNAVGKGTIYLRAFKINDPGEFFQAQADPHSPTLRALSQPNTFDMIKMGYEKVTRDARYAARDVMPAESRRAIRDVADLNGTKASKVEKPATKPATGLVVDDIPKGAEHYPIVSSWEYQFQPKKEDAWSYVSVPVPVKEKGVYLVEARARGRRSITVLVISELGMVIKQSNSELLSYVVNTRTGEKVADVPLVVSRAGTRITEKSTGSDGVLMSQVPAPPERVRPVAAVGEDGAADEEEEWRWDYRERQVLVTGEKDGNFVISDPYFYSFGSEGNMRVFLHTDRPVYRPAQIVYYRGIFRNVAPDGTYSNTNGTDTLVAEVQDSRGDMVRRDTFRLSDMGTFNGQFTLGEEPPLGSYSIKVTRKNVPASEEWFNFEVEEYKKPEYKVVVTADKQNYTRGDVIHATVRADYFFGSPVANAEVEYFIYRARYWRPWWRGSDWAYLYESDNDDFSVYRMEMVESDTARLNSDGTLAITYHTADTASEDYVYRVQANVVDNSRRSISGAKSVEVTRGEFYVSTSTDKYVYKPSDKARLDVEIATFDGDKPVATPFNVSVHRTWWEKVPAKNPTEDHQSDYERRTETIWTGNGATDASGKGTLYYTAQRAGYFEVQISARDRRGTEITESNYIYVADANYTDWYREGSSNVQIIPDKPAYKPGETMNAMIVMPAAGLDALITVEGSTIYSHQIERLTSTSAIVHVPIEARYAPSVYLSAAAIVNNELYSESQRISVVPEGKLLHIEVTTDKDTYRPGDKGTVMVRALDEGGSPVGNVDVAVGVVDEAVYAIRPDATPNIQHYFYGTRWNEVSTTSSLNFSFYGETSELDKDATDALYGAAGRRSDASTRLAMAGKNGGRSLAFGDVKGNMFLQPVVRKNFKDMMLWAPSVRTGADGRAKLSLDFPDNLTTWRITARGVTANTAVGEATARVIARKDLLVRMETPRFMIQGDELLIATTIHNYLKSEKITKVEFSGENVSVANREQTITIPANGEKRIDWKVTAPKSGTSSLTVKALTNEESDAMELTVPVLARGMRLATGAMAEVSEPTGSKTINLQLPEGSDPSTGELYVTLSPSLAGSILGSLDSLIGYPYGCVEQTMSRFLPSIVVADVLRKLDLPFDTKKRAAIPKIAARSLSRLYGMQHEDGGWGWWINDKTDPYMTAYVIYGMTIAKREGYDVVDERYNKGLTALQKIVTDGKMEVPAPWPQATPATVIRPIEATTQAYSLYVLSLVNQGKPQRYLTDRIREMGRRDTINNYCRALLTLAASYQGMTAEASALAGALEKSAVVAETYANWQPKARRWDWQSDPVEMTAFAVKALLETRGESDLTRKGVRWLLSQKEGESWHNTRQTATVIYALVDQLKSSGEVNPDYNVVVKVNGQQVFSRQMTRADVFQPEQRVRLDAGLRNGNNSVTVEKSGPGRLYTSARVVYYATGAALRPATSGFKVTREYYTLKKQKRGDIYVYTKAPMTGTVRTGDEIFVKVKVIPDSRYEYFMLEDPLPAGCEVVINTEGYHIAGEAEYGDDKKAQEGDYSWNWWYADRDVRDEKVSFFAREVGARPYEFSYIMRAQIPGSYSVMPSVATLMYFPEVRGNSGAVALNITE